eukprot:GSMAST32.ASY1.ANO1.1147.1 assembled CDS
MTPSPVFLGFDSSTQSLKVTAVDIKLKVVYNNSVNYAKDLPEFRTDNGVHYGAGGKVTSPTLLWVCAFDLILARMQSDGFDFSSVLAISGSGQQHGSVFWRKGSSAILKLLDPANAIAPQLGACFALNNSPVWMDSSTGKYCRFLEETLGGALKTAKITGSRAYDRFTGNQIAKVALEQPEAYQNCERISLVSSCFPCILTGKYVPIDWSDASGMNLMDINTRQWSKECLSACSSSISGTRLGNSPIPSDTVLGNIQQYFVARYGFRNTCKIVTWSGDNPY